MEDLSPCTIATKLENYRIIVVKKPAAARCFWPLSWASSGASFVLNGDFGGDCGGLREKQGRDRRLDLWQAARWFTLQCRPDAICQQNWVTAHRSAPGLFLRVTARSGPSHLTPQGLCDARFHTSLLRND